MLPQLLYDEKKVVSTVFPSWCFHRNIIEYLATVTSVDGTSLYGVCMLFQRCFNGDLKCCLMVWKKIMCARCFNGVSAVRKRVISLSKRAFPNIFNSEEKIVSKVFEWLRKNYFDGK